MPFSQSPPVLKGALVRVDDDGVSTQVVVFQYNPEKLLRKIEVRGDVRGSTRSAAGRRTPQELIICSLVFDATDALERPDQNPRVVGTGISPMLAALELLMYRREASTPRWWEFWRFGARSPSGPLALFVWGTERAVPVRLVRLDITELLHDPELRPIRATVRMTMRVVADEDLPRDHPGVRLWRRHLSGLENLASEGYSVSPPAEITPLDIATRTG
jgi:hypothetical protein